MIAKLDCTPLLADDILLCHGDVQARADEKHARERDDKASPHRRKLFQEHDDCQASDPNDIHDASGKEQQHQRPAASNAIGAVVKAKA